jgi:hypothetical protein
MYFGSYQLQSFVDRVCDGDLNASTDIE